MKRIIIVLFLALCAGLTANAQRIIRTTHGTYVETEQVITEFTAADTAGFGLRYKEKKFLGVHVSSEDAKSTSFAASGLALIWGTLHLLTHSGSENPGTPGGTIPIGGPAMTAKKHAAFSITIFKANF